MRKQLILLGIALSSVLVSCDKDDNNDVKPDMDVKTATEVMITQRAKIAEAKNVVKHLVLPVEKIQSGTKSAKKEGIEYIEKYKEYYNDYSFTKGAVEITFNPNHTVIVVDYGEKTNEFGKIVKGKFTIDIKRISGKFLEKRIWDLSVDGVKVKGTTQMEVYRENQTLIYKGKVDDFKITAQNNVTFTEKGDWENRYTYRKNRVKKGKYETKSSNGITCKYDIQRDLVYDVKFSYRLPIGGIEKVEVIDGNNKSQLVVDYGDGEKDYKVKVTSNGVTKEIDYAKKVK